MDSWTTTSALRRVRRRARESAALFRFQRGHQTGSYRLQGRCASESQARRERQRERPSEQAKIRREVQSDGELHVRGDRCGEEPRSPECEQYRDRSSRECQQGAFRQQLAHHPPASRAHRKANGDFAAPHGRSRQKQIGDVAAGDEPDERRRAERKRRDSTHLRQVVLVPRLQLRDDIKLGRVGLVDCGMPAAIAVNCAEAASGVTPGFNLPSTRKSPVCSPGPQPSLPVGLGEHTRPRLGRRPTSPSWASIMSGAQKSVSFAKTVPVNDGGRMPIS